MTVQLTHQYPCPSWCTRPAGHPFDDVTGREHQWTIVTGPGVHVEIALSEVVDADGQVVCPDGRPGVYVFGSSDHLDARGARQMARALLEAADVLDGI